MATNEILPFASTNTGTNLLTQSEYAADAQRIIGHQPGIARAKLENKVLRQASLLASGLAEFIADYQANNVTDSLTAQQVADYLVVAIAAAFPDATTTVKGKVQLATGAEVQAGTNATKAITPDALIQRTATTTRTGLVGLATNAATQAGTDATVAVTPAGLSSRIATESNTGLIALASGQDAIDGVSTTKALTPAGMSIRTANDVRTGVIRRATVSEVQTMTQNEAFISPARLPFAFASNAGATWGWFRLPNGIIVQFGNSGQSILGNTRLGIFFPLTFPSVVLGVVAGNAFAGINNEINSVIGVEVFSPAGFWMSNRGTGTQTGSAWCAFGF